MTPTIFSPAQLPCGRQLRNRLVKAALYEHLATFYGGPPNGLHFALYATWSAHDWGMIITGNVQVSQTHLSLARDIVLPSDLSDDKLEPFRALANAIHGQREHQPLAIMQLSHAGRQSPNILGGRLPFTAPLGPSRIRVGQSVTGAASSIFHSLMFQTPKSMSIEAIDQVVSAFVHGARVAVEAGFDGIELHAAHGYLLAQFMSPKANKRTDEYSAHGLLFLSRIIHDIRLVVPSKFVLGVKLNSADETTADALQYVQIIASWSLVDFIEISGGDYEKPDFLTESEASPDHRQARFAHFSHRAAQSMESIPSPSRPLILLTGGLSTPAHLSTALSSGHADLLGLGRASVIFPDLPQRVLNWNGQSEEPFIHQPNFRVKLFDRLPQIRLIGAGTIMAWYTVMLRRLAEGERSTGDLGALGGLVWMWLWFKPEFNALLNVQLVLRRLLIVVYVVFALGFAFGINFFIHYSEAETLFTILRRKSPVFHGQDLHVFPIQGVLETIYIHYETSLQDGTNVGGC
ncbi:FMN-linked oxidoreductase [Mycena indigotica]|uniref:FMN-linked oxidoreductase n=1 Tax=Mycena indigotica TaxID=2126181 RepID=A0A8H6TH14_9AGAR|nr:FMN-linked oxidoreductase [Mycena indigotica]KAF7316541.1 FMN-linked oxidoreductase [Mycena indigotica]